MNYYCHYPSTVTQFAEHESHVSWNDEATGFSSIKHSDSRYITTSKDLLHIATFDGHDIKMKPYYLYLTDFKIQKVPNEIDITPRPVVRIAFTIGPTGITNYRVVKYEYKETPDRKSVV